MSFVEELNSYCLLVGGEVSILEQLTTLLDEKRDDLQVKEAAWLLHYRLPLSVPQDVKDELTVTCIGRRWGFEDYSPLPEIERILLFQYLEALPFF